MMVANKESYSILKKVILSQGYCNVLIARMMQKDDFNEKEKLLIQELVNETLKYQIYLNYIFEQIVKGLNFSIEDFNLEFKILLWLMLYQLYFDKVNTQDFALALVKLGREINPKWAESLNKIADFCQEYPKSEFELAREKKMTATLIKYSYPEWLFNLLKEQFSSDIAHSLMKDNIKIPIISFRVNTLKISVASVLKDESYKDYNFHLSSLVSDGIISNKVIFMTELYRSGKIIKQDQASMLVSHILDPKPYDLIWDMCAGIGSKTAHIAALINNHSKIYATDIDSERLNIAKGYFDKLGVKNVKLINIDATKWEHKEQFDKILIDAPSSAFGLIKRKPELKLINWTKQQMHELVLVQSKLLDKAYKSLKDNGILVYVTCTFNIYENQMQIEKFIKRYPNMIIIEERQIFGVHETSDGFYICKLRKVRGK